MNKIIAALFFTFPCAAALAAQTNNSMPISSGVNLVAPHQEGSWSFGLQGNYFEPNTDYNFFHIADEDLIPLGDSDRTYNVGTDYNLGWGADISYHFPGNGRDVTLAVTQLSASHSNSATDPTIGFRLGDLITFTQNGRHSAEVDTDYDAVDLTFGQLITIGTRLSLHPFAGLRYASIDYKAKPQDDDTYNTDLQLAPTVTIKFSLNSTDESTWESDFQGLGPRFGSDAAVNLGNGFSLRSTLGLSLLVGSIDVDEKQSANELATIYFNDNLISSTNNVTNSHNEVQTNTRVVPEADAKLSAMYTTYVDNGYSLSFEAGYQVTNYFDAIQNSVMSTQDTSTQYTNYFMQGPFGRVELDVA